MILSRFGTVATPIVELLSSLHYGTNDEFHKIVGYKLHFTFYVLLFTMA
jgi:hypothetical protein